MKFEKTFRHILSKYDKFGTTQKFLDKHLHNDITVDGKDNEEESKEDTEIEES